MLFNYYYYFGLDIPFLTLVSANCKTPIALVDLSLTAPVCNPELSHHEEADVVHVHVVIRYLLLISCPKQKEERR